MFAAAVFPQSSFVPVALGFFGLAIGYLIVGGSQVLPVPATRNIPAEEKIPLDHAMGAWMIWMPGFMQFITGVWLFTGLTWFDVFEQSAPLYMAALAFTAYGVHWFVLGYRRWEGASAIPEGFMAIGYIVLSVLGAIVFFTNQVDVPVGILFVLLSAIYVVEAPTKLGYIAEGVGGKLVATIQFITGLWLLYLTMGVTLNLTAGYNWWV